MSFKYFFPKNPKKLFYWKKSVLNSFFLSPARRPRSVSCCTRPCAGPGTLSWGEAWWWGEGWWPQHRLLLLLLLLRSSRPPGRRRRTRRSARSPPRRRCGRCSCLQNRAWFKNNNGMLIVESIFGLSKLCIKTIKTILKLPQDFFTTFFALF